MSNQRHHLSEERPRTSDLQTENGTKSTTTPLPTPKEASPTSDSTPPIAAESQGDSDSNSSCFDPDSSPHCSPSTVNATPQRPSHWETPQHDGPESQGDSPSNSSASSDPSSSPDSFPGVFPEGRSAWNAHQHEDPYSPDLDDYFAQARPQRAPSRLRRNPGTTPAEASGSADETTSSPRFASPLQYAAQAHSKKTYYFSSYSTDFRRNQGRRRVSVGSTSSHSSDSGDDDSADDDDCVAFDAKPLKLQVLVVTVCHLLGYLLCVALSSSTGSLSSSSSQMWMGHLSYILAAVPGLVRSPLRRMRWSSAAISLHAASKILFPPIRPHLLESNRSLTQWQLWTGSLLWTLLCLAPHALGTTSSRQPTDEGDYDEEYVKQWRKRAKRRVLLGFLLGFGVAVECLADVQQRRFYRTHSAHEFSFVGLYTCAQHPEAFGNMCLWLGVWACHVASLINSTVRVSSRHRLAKRCRRYTERYWRVIAATLLLGWNFGVQWGRISGFWGTQAEMEHIHYGYGVDPTYTHYADTVPLLWGTVPFDPSQHRQHANNRQKQHLQSQRSDAKRTNQKEERGAGGSNASSNTATAPDATKKASSTKGNAASHDAKAPDSSSIEDLESQGTESNRPLDDIMKWYALLEERDQDIVWKPAVDDASERSMPGVASNRHRHSLRAGQRKQGTSQSTPEKRSSSAGLREDNASSRRHRRHEDAGRGGVRGDVETEEWKKKILELVRKSKYLQTGAVDSSPSDENVAVVFPSKGLLKPENYHESLFPRVPEVLEGHDESQNERTGKVGVSVQFLIDGGAYKNLVGVESKDEYLPQRMHESCGVGTVIVPGPLAESKAEHDQSDFKGKITNVRADTIDSYEATLREVTEAFEVVIRTFTETLEANSDGPSCDAMMPKTVSTFQDQAASKALGSVSSSEQEASMDKGQPEPLNEFPSTWTPYLAPDDNRYAVESQGSLEAISLGKWRTRNVHDELDLLATKLVTESVSFTKKQLSEKEAPHDVSEQPSTPGTRKAAQRQPATLPHTRMEDIRLLFNLQVNDFFSKYVFSLDESFEQFVARHQKGIKDEVLKRSSYLAENLSRIWSDRVVEYLETLRVPRLHDLTLIDLGDEDEPDHKPQTAVDQRRCLDVLRVSRLRDLWNVDLETDMNVSEESSQENPFERLRVDRLRELWLVDDE